MVPSDLSNLQHGAEPALQRWAEHGLTRHGRAYPPALRAAAVQAVSRLAREIWMVQAGTTLSTRLRGTSPNSFNRLKLHRAMRRRSASSAGIFPLAVSCWVRTST